MTTQPRYYAAARGSFAGEVASAVRDFGASFRQHSLWATLAWNDILQRYRGSLLGPFWIVLTNAAFAIGIGLVYSEIMNISPDKYVPWIATGVVVWNLVATSIQEGGDAFVSQGVLIRQSSTPLPVFIWRVVLRNLYNLAHQMVVVVGVAVYFGYVLSINWPMAVLGLLLVLINVSWAVLLVSITAARFRDLQQAIVALLQVAFFLSPVIWMPHQTETAARLLQVNPVFHMLEVMRDPLIGQPVDANSIVFLLILAAVGWVASFLVYAMVRRRIVHYL